MNRQGNLFEAQGVRVPGEVLQLDAASHLELVEPFVGAPRGDELFEELITTIPWRQDHLVMHGTRVAIPRLQSWHGDPGSTYMYSGMRLEPEPWTASLAELRNLVQDYCDAPFNSVLANLYRDGNDALAWHSDDEPELGTEPVIASVSFGATRRFLLRRRIDHADRRVLDLRHGSLLVMRGATQRIWEHRVPRTARAVTQRINLTFRQVN